MSGFAHRERSEDRADAGRELARVLRSREFDDPIVLGLPRGGVPVAVPIARALHAPLDVLIVRKVGVPGHEEVAMAAVGEEDAAVRNRGVIDAARVDEQTVLDGEARERTEVQKRSRMLRAGRDAEPLGGRTAILVDDGIATGASMKAACEIARKRGAARIVVAVPVAPQDVIAELGAGVDAVVVLSTPADFMAVGMHYLDFRQTSDEEVVRLLAEAR